MKNLKSVNRLARVVFCLLFIPCLVAAQTVTRLTSSGTPKHAYTISGNGSVVVWIEDNSGIYSMKAVNTEGVIQERTLFTTDSSGFITGVVGPFGGQVQVFYYALRVSYDGAVAALHVYDRNGQKECIALVDTSGGAIQVIPAGVPANMGDSNVLMLDPAAFDLSDEGGIVVYSLTANNSSGSEAASAVIGILSGTANPYRLAGYTAKQNGWWGAVTYSSSGPNHVGRPSVAGDYIAVSGNANAQTEDPDLADIYLMALGGGSTSVYASGMTGQETRNLGSYLYNYKRLNSWDEQTTAYFYPVAGGPALTLIDPSVRASFPFFDTEPGIVSAAVGLQTASVLSVIRSGGEVEQLKSDDPQLPSGWNFGSAGTGSYETWNLVPRNGGRILFTMFGNGQQDLFVQNGIKSAQATATPTPIATATNTPVWNTPTPTNTPVQGDTPTPAPTLTPTPSIKTGCSLSVETKCLKKVSKGRSCRFQAKLYNSKTKVGISGAGYYFEKKEKGKNYQRAASGKLNSKGIVTPAQSVKKTYTYRMQFPAYSCVTKAITVTVGR